MRNLRQRREERGWTQLDLAVRLGVSLSTITKWERGVVVPSEANLYRLMLLLATTSPNDAPQHDPPPAETTSAEEPGLV